MLTRYNLLLFLMAFSLFLNLRAQAEEGMLYRTSAMRADPADPGACIWTIGPQGAGARELITILITAGYVAPDNPVNFKTILTTMGTDLTAQAPLDFSEAIYSATIAETGEDVNSAALAQHSQPGEKYEIHMPLNASFAFMDGAADGMHLRAVLAGTGEIIAHDFPPAEPAAVEAYGRCLAALAQGVRESQQAPGAAAEAPPVEVEPHQ